MLSIVQLVVVLCVIGLVWWLVTTYLPLPAPLKTIITVLLVLLSCLYLLSWVGIIPAFPGRLA